MVRLRHTFAALVASACLLLPHTSVRADTVWNPAGNSPPIVPPASGNWNDPGNWTAGMPVSVSPGDFKAVFNRANTAECHVTDSRSVNLLVQGDNGDGGLIRIRGGGKLIVSQPGEYFCSVGYNRNARMIVESGAMLECLSHLFIGLYSPAIGTLEINGGSVKVSGQIGLGWNTGTGRVKITNGGILNLAYFDSTKGIKGTSTIDIEDGSVVINGNVLQAALDYVAANRIIAYGGSGAVICDYNVSNPGKTTVRALDEPIPVNWRVVQTSYPTTERIVTPYDAQMDFGIIADGVTDVTRELQTALIMVSNLGGGALFLPAGHYKITGNLLIPPAVTLRGDWRKPDPGGPVVGTVLKAYAGRDNETAAPFIKMSSGSGLNGVSIWYPEQVPDDIRPYPPTVGNGGDATVENVTFVNSWWAYTSFVAGTTARPFLRNIFGTPLKTGIEFDCLADIGRIETVHFSPAFWRDSGLSNAPTAGQHAAWIRENGTGVILRRIDWSYSCYVTVEGYRIGLALRPGRHDGSLPNGQSYGFDLIGCKTGVHVEASSYAGYQFTRFRVLESETGVELSPSAAESVMFHSCEIESSRNAVFCQGATARLMMMGCDIRGGGVRMARGYLSILHSDFAANEPVHIELEAAVAGATILGNRFAGAARIINRTRFPVHIDHSPVPADPMPAYSHRKPSAPYQAAKADLFVVTAAPYNAKRDGVTDDTAAFQQALSAAAENGGGTVFVPGGNYRLDGTLTVPTGVELRGVFDTPHGTNVKGSLLNVHSGRNDASGVPFIQLQSGSGIRGFTFHYPGQIYDVNDTVNYGMVPYPFLIRGLGPDIHIINLAATIPYQLLDLATHRCDRHYVDYIYSTALKTGIHAGGGSVDGQIHNCQFNPSSYTHVGTYYASIPLSTSANIHKILWRDATPYLFGHMTGEVLHQNFVFGGAYGFRLVEEQGFGPSGHCLGMGVDQCTIAMQIDHVGGAGLDPINSQIVTINTVKGRYLETGSSLAGTFRMFSSAGWGGHEFSAAIHGGDVRLQLFHLARDGEAGAFKVTNGARLQSLGGGLDDYLAAGRPFLTIDPTANATFAGNIINTTEGQMPVNSDNVTALGNLRYGAPASGSATSWSNGAGTRDWNSSANWSAGIPEMDDDAIVASDLVEGPVIGPATNAGARNLVVGDLASAADTLEVNGGTLSINGWMILGNGQDGLGSLLMKGGAATIGGDCWVGLHGDGMIDVSSGTLTIGGMLDVSPEAGATARISIGGGTIRAGSLHMAEGGILDISSGMLVIDGDVTTVLETYINQGRIIAQGGAFLPTLDYNLTHPGKTTLAAIPPPLQTTVWSPQGSRHWTENSNWSGGNAPLVKPQHLKVVFNKTASMDCLLDTAATVGQLVMGDSGSGGGHFLTLAPGAFLNSGLSNFGQLHWTGIGYSKDARMTVMHGAELNCADHLWIGYFSPAVGVLEIQGGSVRVSGMFGLGWSGGTGIVRITRGGTLHLNRLDPTRSFGGESVLDIESGSLAITGDHVNVLGQYSSAGKITAYGGTGTLNSNYNPESNLTLLNAVPPPNSFHSWATEWDAEIGGPADDPDGDQLPNLLEYAFNGDPTRSSDRGTAPGIQNESGSLIFRHLVRKNDANLAYTIESSPDLTPGSWVHATFEVIETLSKGEDYNEIACRVPVTGNGIFIRVRINHP
jgi:hypothetical protein